MAESAPAERESQPFAPATAKRGGLGRIVKIVVSAGLIALVLSRTNFADIGAAFARANVGMLAFAGSLTFIGALLTASRWRVLLAAQSVIASTLHLIRCWMMACFFNQFLPSTIGGDARRMYDSWRLGATKAGAVAAIGVDRVLGLIALMAYGVAALYFSTVFFERQAELQLFVGVIAVGLVVCAALVFAPRTPFDRPFAALVEKSPKLVRKIVGKFQAPVAAYRGQGKVLVTSMLLSLALQLNVITFYFLVGTALGMELTFVDYMIVVPVASVILLLPITINGIGLREGIFVLLLGGFGVETSTAIAFAWASFALFLLFGLLGGVVYAFYREPETTPT
ncbi:MAG: lysylphosphatidylglycerol synthase transmembrane domain-containing protein [Pseudomonadota bacterium]